MTLVDLSINETTLKFLPYSGFTYVSTLSVQGYEQPSNYSSDFEFTFNQSKLRITSVRVNDVVYTEKVSLSDCLSDSESFYLDFENQKLHVHFSQEIKPYDNIVSTLKASSYSNRLYIDNALEASYLPLLKSDISIKKKADKLNENKMVFSKQNIEFFNGQGDFDVFFDDPIPSSLVTISFVPDDDLTATPKKLYAGLVAKDVLTTESFKLELEDIRKIQSIEIPREEISSIDYPDIDDDIAGTTLATGYGFVRGIPAFCVNGQVKTGNVNYIFADFSTSITTVYVKVEDYWTPVTPVSTSSGSVVLSATYARNDNGDPRDCKVDATLYNLNNPADIIVDLNDRYLNLPFDSSNYDITVWNSEKGLIDAPVGILLDKEKKIERYIEEIQNSSNRGFIYDVDGSGKRIIRVNYDSRIIARNVSEIELVSKRKTSIRDFSEYAAEVKVQYKKDYESDRYFSVTDRTYFNDAVNTYTNAKKLTLPTLLTDTVDAEDKAFRLARDNRLVRALFNIEVADLWAYDIKRYDFLNVDFGYIGESIGFDSSGERIRANERLYVGERLCKVLNIDYKTNDNKVSFDLIEIIDDNTFTSDAILEFNDNPDFILEFSDNPLYILDCNL